jgi:hypothetical protein
MYNLFLIKEKEKILSASSTDMNKYYMFKEKMEELT